VKEKQGQKQIPFEDDNQKGKGNSGEDKVLGSFDSARCAPLRMTRFCWAIEAMQVLRLRCSQNARAASLRMTVKG
jgi:hypothetical protein